MIRFALDYIKKIFQTTILLFGVRKRTPIRNYNDLLDFVDQQTSYQVQRSFDDYCRARVSINWQKLYKEDGFHDAYRKAIWTAYPLVMADMIEMVGLCMYRDKHMKQDHILNLLKQCVCDVCKRYDVPKGFESDFWKNAAISLNQRIDIIDVTSDKPIHRVCVKHFKHIFNEIPIAKELRDIDYRMLLTNQRFLLCNAYEVFKKLLDLKDSSIQL